MQRCVCVCLCGCCQDSVCFISRQINKNKKKKIKVHQKYIYKKKIKYKNQVEVNLRDYESMKKILQCKFLSSSFFLLLLSVLLLLFFVSFFSVLAFFLFFAFNFVLTPFLVVLNFFFSTFYVFHSNFVLCRLPSVCECVLSMCRICFSPTTVPFPLFPARVVTSMDGNRLQPFVCTLLRSTILMSSL